MLLGLYGGRYWYNDSKATNLSATLGSIQALADRGPLTVLMGGQLKETIDIKGSLPSCVKQVIGFGASGEQWAAAWSHQCITHAVDCVAKAVEYAYAHTLEGETILFAPGGASFDAFENYQARGKVFEAAVIEEAKEYA